MSHSEFNSPLVATICEPLNSPLINSGASDTVKSTTPSAVFLEPLQLWVKLVKLLKVSKEPPSPPSTTSTDPVSYPLGNDLTEPLYCWSSQLACGCGYLYLSKIVGLTVIPEAKDVLAGTKSLIILNNELSKNLINLT